MSNLVRLSIAIDASLLGRLEKMIKASKCANRSEFIRDMIRDHLVRQEWRQDRETVGTITLLYDHHVRRLTDRLTDAQHVHHEAILATTHVHLDEHMCVEMILVKARARQIRAIADVLGRQKGVLHAALSMSSSGRALG